MDITTLAAIIGALAAIVGALILLLSSLGILKPRPPSIRVKKIETADDLDLSLALKLYNGNNRGIPENAKDSPENIVRWLQEVQEETEQRCCRLKDYFLVAKVQERVYGLLYGHYYPERRLMFLSYIVTDENVPEARGGDASAALTQYLSREWRKRLKDLEGIVFELDYERYSALKRLFLPLAQMQKVVVKEININYLQPMLSLWENGYQEERQVLMYGRTLPPHLSTTIPRDEVKKVLGFIYMDIYGDYFGYNPDEDAKYRQYLEALYERVVAGLPEEIKVS